MAVMQRLAVSLCAFTVFGDDMSTVRERARELFGWPAANAVPQVATAAMGFMKSLNTTCYWPDIDYESTSRADWLALNHLSRLSTMVQALTAPSSPVFEDAGLSTATHCALGVWLSRDFTNSNWWYEWIGIEMDLQACFLMLGSNRTTPAEQKALIEYSYNSAWWVNDFGGGANLVWMITVEIMRGAASSNTTALQEGFAELWANAVMGNVTSNWQGVVADNAYHFHGQQILPAAYGQDWAISLLQFWQVAAGTQWAMPSEHVAVIAAFVAEGDAVVSFGGRYDWGVVGREIDRPGLDFSWGLPVATITALAADPGAAPWQGALLDFASRISGVIPQGDMFNVSKFFWTSDFYAHHRRGWGAALKMHGNNGVWTVVQNECDNSENLLAEHTGDGVLNVYPGDYPSVASDSYANVFPMLDWNSINGITVEHDKPIETCGSGNVWPVRDTSFVGGVSDGLFGASAMDTATHNTTAQRSWFFFDSSIVALATNLTNGYGAVASPGDVWTTLMSRLVPQASADPEHGDLTASFANGSTIVLRDGAYSFSGGDVSWFNIGGIGVLPAVVGTGVHATSPSLGLTVGNRTGDWATIGAYSGKVAGRVASATLQHGNTLPPSAASTNGYAYILVPGVTAVDMPAYYANNANASCIVATESVHGAAQVSAGVAAAVFWATTGGSYACPALGLNLTTHGAGLVLYREDTLSTQGSLTVAHPTQIGGFVNVTVGGRVASGPACTPGPAPSSTTYSVRLPADINLLGSSVTVTCEL